MDEVKKQLPVAVTQPGGKEDFGKIGDINYDHPFGLLMLKYRALIYIFLNPPDPRGDKMCSRPGPYTVRVVVKDMAEAIEASERTVQRALQLMRENRGLKKNAWITVEEFCNEHNLPEDMIQKKLNARFMDRWNRNKDNNKDEDDDE
jgi:hypothetical protein